MPTSITLSGSLTMQSTNGDAPQLLTEAAEFVNALAQLGVTVGVRIELAPVAASPAANPPPSARLLADGPQLADGALKQLLPGSVMPIPNAPLDPTPAAPAQPDEPQNRFRTMPESDRFDAVLGAGRALTRALGHPPKISEWNEHRLPWLPMTGGLCKASYGPSKWSEWQSLFETTTATPSSE